MVQLTQEEAVVAQEAPYILNLKVTLLIIQALAPLEVLVVLAQAMVEAVELVVMF